MKGYKGFDKNLQCRGFQYEIGKTYHIKDKPILCDNGFHFCKKLTDVHEFYDLHKSRVCEIEAFGSIEHSKYEEKSVCNSITIIRELTREEILSLANIGKYNTGLWNSGINNSGSRNSGSNNSGSWNSGINNSGIGNSGDNNSGSWNSGINNSGIGNSGSFCSCNKSSGIFMSKKITYEAFNKVLSEYEYEQLLNSYGFSIVCRFKLVSFKSRRYKGGKKETTCLSYKESWRIFWDSLTPKEKLAVKRIPHFDADVFYDITGIKLSGAKND